METQTNIFKPVLRLVSYKRISATQRPKILSSKFFFILNHLRVNGKCLLYARQVKLLLWLVHFKMYVWYPKSVKSATKKRKKNFSLSCNSVKKLRMNESKCSNRHATEEKLFTWGKTGMFLFEMEIFWIFIKPSNYFK